MGCFCRLAVDAMLAEQADTAERPAAPKDTDRSDQEQLVQAASRWLAARWLPAPPWEPDPAWLDEELPPAPLPPEALSVICALIQAGGTAQSVLQLDLTQPEDTRSLARVVATLNERGDALETLAADARPWSELAALNDQADTVRKAASQGVFTPQETPQDEPIEPWRPFLARLKSLAPLVAIGQLMRIDLAEPEAFPAIADRLRQLRAVRLPDLAKPTAVLQIIDRASAIDRLDQEPRAKPRGIPDRARSGSGAGQGGGGGGAVAADPPSVAGRHAAERASPGAEPVIAGQPCHREGREAAGRDAPAVERAALRPVGPADARGAGAVAGRPTRARHGEGDAVRTRLRRQAGLAARYSAAGQRN